MEGSSKEASTPWRPRKHVLVGMGVILGMSALTIITSMILQPADISFFVADFSYSSSPSPRQQGVLFAFNLTSHNPSRRARVMYHSISVIVYLQNNRRPSVRKTAVPANVSDEIWMQCLQGRNSNRTLRVDALLDEKFYSFYKTNPSATITVYAQAWFKVWLARTRLYNIRVSCKRVDLLPVSRGNQSGIVGCSAA